MKSTALVLFSSIWLFLSGCTVVVDKEAGIARTHILGQVISSGYTHHSGITVLNPTLDLRMEAYVAETGTQVKGGIGSDLFVTSYATTNYQNSMTVLIRFYDREGNQVAKDSRMFRVYFYNGSWNDTWTPYPREYLDRQQKLAQIDPNRLAQ